MSLSPTIQCPRCGQSYLARDGHFCYSLSMDLARKIADWKAYQEAKMKKDSASKSGSS